VLLGYAVLLFSAQRYWHDDLAIYYRAVEEVPDSAFWRDGLGMALEERGDFVPARNAFAAAAELEPDNGAHLYNLGAVDDRLGDHRAAEHEMAEGLRLISNPPATGYADLALVEDSAGDKAASEAALKQAEGMPNGTGVAAIARAQLLLRHGGARRADDVLREWLQHNPNDTNARALMDAIERSGTVQ
jgi:tetratricopeptide (TPR) repeat protein